MIGEKRGVIKIPLKLKVKEGMIAERSRKEQYESLILYTRERGTKN